MRYSALPRSGQGLACGLLASILSLVTFAALPVQAAITNPGFEDSPALTGWNTHGSNVVQMDSTIGVSPIDGTYQALLSTGIGAPGASPITTGSMETILGLPSGTLDLFSLNFTTEGSVMTQTFSANAGDMLSFNWNFLTDELPFEIDFNDYGFYTLTNVTSPIVSLGDTFSPLNPLVGGFAQETGYSLISLTLPATGLYTLGFGIVDVGDYVVDTGLLIDGVQLTAANVAAPEPSSVALMASGLAGLGYWRRRQLKAMQA